MISKPRKGSAVRILFAIPATVALVAAFSLTTRAAETAPADAKKQTATETLPATAGTVVRVTAPGQAGDSTKVTPLTTATGKKSAGQSKDKAAPLILGQPAPLFIIDGKRASDKEANALDPNQIGSISVLKDTLSMEKYGKEGKNGVVVITTKKAAAQPPKTEAQAQAK